MKKFLYIYNPYSGTQVGGHELDRIIATFYKRDVYVIPHRLYTMDEDTVLEDLLKTPGQFDAVIAAGGDGTIGYIIDKMLKYGNDTPVGIVPGGTCNDFARNLKMPQSVFECINVFADMKVKKVDMMKIKAGEHEQYICNSIAAGVFVGVSHTTSPEFKKVFGSLAYYITAVGELANIKPFNIKIKTDESEINEEALVFAVLNGTDVGGMKKVICDADITDGKMNIMVVKNCNPAERAAVGIDLLAHRDNKNVLFFECPKCSISVDKDMDVSLDGESGVKLPYDIEVIPGKLSVIVPEGF